LHGDPRDKHDNDFIPSDDDSDHGYGHPGVGIGPMSDFSASASSAGDQGTLAGGNGKKTDAGIWATGKMKETGEYKNLLSYWVSRKRKTEPTKDQMNAYNAYNAYMANYNQYNGREKTTSRSTKEVGHGRWRATKKTQAGSLYGMQGPWRYDTQPSK
jgi:hypothetical protein